MFLIQPSAYRMLKNICDIIMQKTPSYFPDNYADQNKFERFCTSYNFPQKCCFYKFFQKVEKIEWKIWRIGFWMKDMHGHPLIFIANKFIRSFVVMQKSRPRFL